MKTNLNQIKGFLAFCFCFIIINIQAQDKTRKDISACRIDEAIKIDGKLTESAWKKAIPANNFISYNPINGKKPYLNTEVKVLFNNEALYIGAIMYDSSPDSILKELCERDNEWANTDMFEIQLQPYNDGLNEFVFKVTASNVQIDKKIINNSGDLSWNEVWLSEVSFTENAWIVEIMIPFSAIRFPDNADKSWGVNFYRTIRRNRETSSWNYADNSINKSIQVGTLSGIKDIKSPLRLSFNPYISGYIEHYTDEDAFSYSYTGGLDLKYGLNEAFTLDMTLVPDFGQVKSDDKVLNLSPYETRYGENRAFFTEGIELFTKSGLFYSRRIGGTPTDYYDAEENLNDNEKLIENPSSNSLINAAKLTGRTKNHLGIGVFNAMTSNSFALAEDSLGNQRKIATDVFTNYNIVSFDRSFKNNSYLNLINTNVLKPGRNYLANVTGAAYKIMDKTKTYGIHGIGAVSVIRDSTGKSTIGENFSTNIGKHNGKLYYNYNLNICTDKYDPNDMAYLAHNNYISHNSYIRYGKYEPIWKLLSLNIDGSMAYSTLYKPQNFTKLFMQIGANGLFKNFTSFGFNVNTNLKEEHNYFETRADNRYFIVPRISGSNLWLSTDYRKRLAFDISSGIYMSKLQRRGIWFNISPRFRVSDKMMFIYRFSGDFDNKNYGWTETYSNDSVFFGLRDVHTITNAITTSYIFTNKSAISLRVRHYWSKVNYKDFYFLNNDGSLTHDASYTEDEDLNYNAFTVDLTYSWNFAPGSYLNFVWKNNIEHQNTIYNNEFLNYKQNLNKMFGMGMMNSLSLKLTYYLDAGKYIG